MNGQLRDDSRFLGRGCTVRQKLVKSIAVHKLQGVKIAQFVLPWNYRAIYERKDAKNNSDLNVEVRIMLKNASLVSQLVVFGE